MSSSGRQLGEELNLHGEGGGWRDNSVLRMRAVDRVWYCASGCQPRLAAVHRT